MALSRENEKLKEEASLSQADGQKESEKTEDEFTTASAEVSKFKEIDKSLNSEVNLLRGKKENLEKDLGIAKQELSKKSLENKSLKVEKENLEREKNHLK